MPKFSQCPACGAPMPARWGPRGVACEYCGTFLNRAVLDPQLPHQDLPDEPLEFIPPTPIPSPRFPENLSPTLPKSSSFQFNPETLRRILPKRARRFGRRLIVGIVLVVLVACLSCLCLVIVLGRQTGIFLNLLNS